MSLKKTFEEILKSTYTGEDLSQRLADASREFAIGAVASIETYETEAVSIVDDYIESLNVETVEEEEENEEE